MDISFVEQVTLMSTILLGFSLPVTARLLSPGGAQASIDNAPGDRRVFSTAITLFVLSAAAMLISTFIGFSLMLLMGHFPAQPTAQVTIALEQIWGFPLLGGLVAFMLALSLFGWTRSRLVGVILAVFAIGMAVTAYFVWNALGPLY